MRKVYLDNAATTPLLPGVHQAMMPYRGNTFGNPSSPQCHETIPREKRTCPHCGADIREEAAKGG